MSKSFQALCHRAAVTAMSELNTDVQFRTLPKRMIKNEHHYSKFNTASEVRARMCLNKILSPKEWACILGITAQSITRFRNGERILPEHQEKIFKVFLAVTDGMLLSARDIRSNTPQVKDWVAEELMTLELD